MFGMGGRRPTGDRQTDWSLSKQGGKGLFTAELEQALLRGDAHAAVHSCKDLPGENPPGLAVAGFLYAIYRFVWRHLKPVPVPEIQEQGPSIDVVPIAVTPARAAARNRKRRAR